MPTAMPFDFAGYDVDGQAGATLGTWSFECTITTTLAAEVNVALVSLAAEGGAASIAISVLPFTVEANLVPTKEHSFNPWATAEDTLLKRELEIGDPTSREHDTVDQEWFHGASHVRCGVADVKDKIDYFRSCFGQSLVVTGGAYEVKSEADLTLVTETNAIISAKQRASMTVEQSLLDMSSELLAAQAKKVTICGDEVTIQAKAESLYLYGTNKVFLDAGSPTPPSAPPFLKVELTVSKPPSNLLRSAFKGVLNKMGLR